MKYFTIDELCTTATGLKNIPAQAQKSNLIALVENVLDPVRALKGSPITVNSAFRSPAVNDAVKGAPKSQHLRGEAADLTCDNNKLLFELIRDHFQFDQLINEYNFKWVHVSFSQIHNRNQILIIT